MPSDRCFACDRVTAEPSLVSAQVALEKQGVRARKQAERKAAAAAEVDKEQRMLEEKKLCFECVNIGKGCLHFPFATEQGRDRHCEKYCKFRPGQRVAPVTVQERAAARSRAVGGTNTAAVNRDKNCAVAIELEKNLRKLGRFSEQEISSAAMKIAGAKTVMASSVAQVHSAEQVQSLCERFFPHGWGREAKRKSARFNAEQKEILEQAFDEQPRVSDSEVMPPTTSLMRLISLM